MTDGQRKQRLYQECPTPRKSRFATMKAAEAAVKKASFELDKTLYIYDTCLCGWLHLTSKKGEIKPPTLTGLGSADEETFARVVRDDVRRVAHADDSAALRHPENLMRWKRELIIFDKELGIQQAQNVRKSGPEIEEWRTRIGIVRAAIAGVRRECMALAEAYHAELTARHRESVQRRTVAGEAAVKRLIKEHQLEFQQYLAEECEALGVEVPRRVQRHIELARLETEREMKETRDQQDQ